MGTPGSAKPPSERNTSNKPDKAPEAIAAEERAIATIGMDSLGIAGVPMPLGSQSSQQGSLGEPLGDMDPTAGGAGAGEADAEKAGASEVGLV